MPKLTARFVETVSEAGKYGDQHGLILRVTPRGTKQWIWRGTIRGKRRDLGLGGYPYTTLAEARQTAFEYRKLARAGGDPAALRRSPAPTFAEACEAVIALHSPGWRDPRRVHNWRSSLERFAYPRLATKTVDTITAEDVLAVIGPIWADRRETARKVKGRISAVMAWAIAEGHRTDDPVPAVTRALPRNGHHVKHHKALPASEVGSAIATVRASGCWWATASCFELIALTGVRSGEARLATWDEIDLDAALWEIPHDRTKTGKPQRVPLSARAVQVLRDAHDRTGGAGLIFPSVTGRAMSDSTASKLLRELDIPGTVHGLRATLRSWMAEEGVPREVAEQVLGHAVAGVEGAYQRSDLLDARRGVLEAWSAQINP